MLLKIFLLANSLALINATPTRRDINLSNAEIAYRQLQQWYDSSTGLWGGMWWHSGSILSTLCSVARIDQSLSSEIASIVANSYTAAQSYTYSMKTSTGFIGDFYDDEAWWALGLIDAYDLTANPAYLQTAEQIFSDMYLSFGQTPCNNNNSGGIYWDKAQTYINAIANELFLSLAAHLANRSPERDYTSIAIQQWTWLRTSGLLQPSNLITDGLIKGTCQSTISGWEGRVWSYNQGVILGGLVELTLATNDQIYLSSAQTIADAAISHLASDGILREPCEEGNSCDGDQTQFKGIFIRGLARLGGRYAGFIDSNAEAIWDRGQKDGLISVNWDRYNGTSDASTQSSGLDCLVAALAT